MYRSQHVHYRSQAPVYLRSPNDPAYPVYPRQRPIHWGLFEILSSVMFISLSLMFVAGIAALVLHIVGFDSLTQLYGVDQVIEHFEIGPPPRIG